MTIALIVEFLICSFTNFNYKMAEEYQPDNKATNIKRLFPITITEKLTETKEFYTKLFGFEVVFEADWYIHMRHASGVEIAVMLPNLENQPAFLHGAYAGNGIVYSLEVDDATAEYERLKWLGTTFVLKLKDEEWGQRHFMMKDPSGIFVDVVQQLSQ